MRVWHDDERPAPDGWIHARSNDEAKLLLRTHRNLHGVAVYEISLDHDLGASAEDIERYGLAARGHEDCGCKLVEWMIEEGLVPGIVTVHSWNPDAAKKMCDRLNNAGFDVRRTPWSPEYAEACRA